MLTHFFWNDAACNWEKINSIISRGTMPNLMMYWTPGSGCVYFERLIHRPTCLAFRLKLLRASCIASVLSASRAMPSTYGRSVRLGFPHLDTWDFEVRDREGSRWYNWTVWTIFYRLTERLIIPRRLRFLGPLHSRAVGSNNRRLRSSTATWVEDLRLP